MIEARHRGFRDSNVLSECEDNPLVDLADDDDHPRLANMRSEAVRPNYNRLGESWLVVPKWRPGSVATCAT